MAQSAVSRGLPVSRLINVEVDISPAAVPFANFDLLMIVGASDVIDQVERFRSYNDLMSVADDFGTTAPEYLAAQLFFSQMPQPAEVMIGRWIKTATAARLYCGPLTAAQMAMSNWTSITAGSFKIGVNGAAAVNIPALNFSGASNLNGVASIIQTALNTAFPASPGPQVTCTWDGAKFVFKTLGTNGTGATATLSYLTAGTSNDISIQLQGTAALAQGNVTGAAAETPVQAVIALDESTWFYGLMFAVSPTLADGDRIAVASYIEGAGTPHVYGITSNDPVALTPTDTTSIGAVLKAQHMERSFVLWSSSNPYAVAGWFGVAFTVNFNASNSTITMMWKQIIGIAAEYLSSAQADALNANNYNYFAEFNVGAAIIVNGIMCGGFYFDEIWGTDWLANQIQIDLFNLLYQSPKVPQTNPGIHMLVNTADGGLSQGVINGLIAPGVWNAPGFGTLQYGNYLANGWYTFANSVDTQDQADREARIAPLIQIAVKLAGAVHFANVVINVNR